MGHSGKIRIYAKGDTAEFRVRACENCVTLKGYGDGQKVEQGRCDDEKEEFEDGEFGKRGVACYRG